MKFKDIKTGIKIVSKDRGMVFKVNTDEYGDFYYSLFGVHHLYGYIYNDEDADLFEEYKGD